MADDNGKLRARARAADRGGGASGRRQDDSIAEALRDVVGRPFGSLASDFLETPAQRTTREIARSLDRPFSNALVPGASPLSETIGDAMFRSGIANAQAAVAGTRPLVDTISQNLLGGGLDRDVVGRSIREAVGTDKRLLMDVGLADAARDARVELEKAFQPLGGLASAFSEFEKQNRTAARTIAEALGGPIGEAARVSQWASEMTRTGRIDLERLLGTGIGTAVEEIQKSINGIFGPSATADRRRMSELLGLTAASTAAFGETRVRMSALAAIGDTYGMLSPMGTDAYASLFGEWRTRPDLPEEFWRDARMRRRMYREAEADEGLVTARPGEAIEVMVESGLAAGLRSDGGAALVVRIGGVSMSVRSRDTGRDAYAVVTEFERRLRAYVARKLEEREGPEWFSRRASNFIGSAKAIRKEAMKRGEAYAPLIEFVELGDLMQIVLAKPNWTTVFESVFVNRADFGHDMQKLIAGRRPTMHSRPVDGLRLTEMICVVQRLCGQMEDDGEWAALAESEL